MLAFLCLALLQLHAEVIEIAALWCESHAKHTSSHFDAQADRSCKRPVLIHLLALHCTIQSDLTGCREAVLYVCTC